MRKKEKNIHFFIEFSLSQKINENSIIEELVKRFLLEPKKAKELLENVKNQMK